MNLSNNKISCCILFFFLVFIGSNLSFAQNYSVSTYQKINELNGGFNGLLDIDDSWGISIDNIGDLDGNGVNDLAVGAFADDDGGYNKGAVWILFLDVNDMVISFTKISDTSGGFNGVLDNNDRFGGGVANLGDMNNDGLTELAVTADYDGDGGYWHGAIWILSLNPDGTVNSHTKISDTEGGFTGFINGDAIFGTDVENIGDLNSDGVDDLAVGSRRDADGGSARGAVWILFMNPDFTVNGFQKISDIEGGFNADLNFEDYFGGSVANIGDLDNDGVVDLVVGSYRDDDQMTNSGSFYVLFLNSDGTVKNYQKVSNLAGGFSGQISANAIFGESIDGVIDIDNDGKIEIIVGALRQINPTLSVPTGAFFLIELEDDGTVSEQYLYTYGENCFSGELNNGDFFGGSVTVLKSGGNVSFAVGAYKDSENGSNKGAVWILNLGEISYTLSEVFDPTCQGSDGEIHIADLNANSDYNISFHKDEIPVSLDLVSDSGGGVEVTNLDSGTYRSIIITEASTGCSDNLGEVVLNDSTIDAQIFSTDVSSCNSPDGTISFSGLNQSVTYTIDYLFNSSPERIEITSSANGEILIDGLASGVYENVTITETTTGCSLDLGQAIINSSTIDAQIFSTDASSCNSLDGNISISGLNQSVTYSIDYLFNSSSERIEVTSSANGEILIDGLASGIYENVTVTEISTGCSIDLGQAIINSSTIDAQISITDASSCDSEDGSISISGLNQGVTYTIDYLFNSSSERIEMTSSANGEILIDGLASGVYENVTITETSTGCSLDLGQSIVGGENLTLQILAENPTNCEKRNGKISIYDLLPNTEYSIRYTYDSMVKNLFQESNSEGEIEINGLDSGIYTNFVISTNLPSCSSVSESIELTCSSNEPLCFKVKKFFTPNNDGVNDSWGLEMVNSCDYTVHIFDRYGKLITVLNPNRPTWDGNYNGRQMPSDDYWYNVDYKIGATYDTFKSHFSLIR